MLFGHAVQFAAGVRRHEGSDAPQRSAVEQPPLALADVKPAQRYPAEPARAEVRPLLLQEGDHGQRIGGLQPVALGHGSLPICSLPLPLACIIIQRSAHSNPARAAMKTIPPAALLLLLLPAARAAEPNERQHWAFRPLARSLLPIRKPQTTIRNPVDAFILEKLEAKGLTLSPEAPKHVFLRRASLDLIGLPPSPEEMDAFLADNRPQAAERAIDRLLASPHFGERWGRHWLDGAGYVDVTGGDNDAATVKLGDGSKWRYRDYVLRAFNEDRPWSRFLTEQIA